MDMRRGWAWIVGVGVGAMSLLVGGCKESREMPAPPPPMVTVAEPLDREVMEWDEYTGRLEAKEWVEVRPRVSGYIESVHFKEGRIVKAGDPLFVIDPR